MAICFCGALVVAIAIPNFVRPRVFSSSGSCINNLRQIDAAAQEFALENHRTNGDPINYPNDLTPYIKPNSQGKFLSCPEGGIYILKKIGDVPICSLGTNVIPPHVLP